MAVPIVEDRTVAGNGYCVGAVAEFDPDTRHLKVGPGIFKLSEEMERYQFPGAELDLPPDTVDVWMLRDRATGQAALGVNVGSGVDDLTYETIERVLHLTCEGWAVVAWDPRPHLNRWDLFWSDPLEGMEPPPGRWSWVIPNPEAVRGDPAPVVIFDEMPAHVRRALEIQNKAAQAADLHRIQRGKKWQDADQDAVIDAILDRLEALDGLEEAT